MATPNFYFDVGSPYAYLAAERIGTLIPTARWQPVLLGGLFKASGRKSWAASDQWRRDLGMSEVERRAADYGLAPVSWPDPWPGNYVFAMRAVTFAFSIEHGEEFAREAFGAAFARGKDLSVPANVLEVAWAVGLDPTELQDGTDDPATKQALRDATDAAFSAGVTGVPTVQVGRRLFWGDDQLEAAAEAAGAGAG
jgi:2-hydroxychromene-2-carboxylate isomerase